MTLRTPKGDPVPLAATEADFDRLVKLSSASDYAGIDQMRLTGTVWSVPNGIRAKIIDRGFFKHEVRILDGTHAGQSGWVASDFAKN